MKYKKLNSVILAMALGLAVTGCGNTASEQAQQETQQESQQETEQESSQETYKELAAGDTAPDFTAQLADGSNITLSEQTDKVVLLNFWATWCGPCVGEMPAFENLAEEYKDEVVVLAVNCLEDEETVNQFIEENGYTFSIAYDVDGSINEKYPTSGIPYTLVIGKDGVVKKIYLGAQDAETQYNEYKSALEEILGE